MYKLPFAGDARSKLNSLILEVDQLCGQGLDDAKLQEAASALRSVAHVHDVTLALQAAHASDTANALADFVEKYGEVIEESTYDLINGAIMELLHSIPVRDGDFAHWKKRIEPIYDLLALRAETLGRFQDLAQMCLDIGEEFALEADRPWARVAFEPYGRRLYTTALEYFRRAIVWCEDDPSLLPLKKSAYSEIWIMIDNADEDFLAFCKEYCDFLLSLPLDKENFSQAESVAYHFVEYIDELRKSDNQSDFEIVEVAQAELTLRERLTDLAKKHPEVTDSHDEQDRIDELKSIIEEHS